VLRGLKFPLTRGLLDAAGGAVVGIDLPPLPTVPAGLPPPAILVVWVARLLPLAVASLPPLAVAPVLANRPRLSLTYLRPAISTYRQ